jgi:hypothetical protein
MDAVPGNICLCSFFRLNCSTSLQPLEFPSEFLGWRFSIICRNDRMETPSRPGRDPIYESIESFLLGLEADGKGKLRTTSHEGSVRLDFESMRVEAPTLEIALVRLANVMIDDPRYSKAICDLLRSPTQAAGQAAAGSGPICCGSLEGGGFAR